MIRENQNFLNRLDIVTDLFVLLLAYSASVGVWLLLISNNPLNVAINPIWIMLQLFSQIILFKFFKLYQSFRYKTIQQEFGRVFTACVVGIIGFATLLYVFRLQDFSRGVLFFIFAFDVLFVFLKRLIVRNILKHYRKLGYNLKHVLLVGGGALALEYVRSINENPQFGYCIAGYIAPQENLDLGKYLGEYENISEFIDGVDEVIIALEPSEIQYIDTIIKECEKSGTKIYIIPFFNKYIPTAPVVDAIGEVKLINMRTIPLDNDFNALIKRTMDICAAIMLIALTSPIMIFAAIGTKLSSPGPVIFKQDRVGKNKKNFTMYKFRSMRINAQSTTAWSKDEDPRKTKFGSFIRKCSIDELPQFFNVLVGDMSIVGPRPEIPHYVEQFKESIPLYMVKHQVRPGITGWAQVNGYRGDTSIEQRIKHDLWYIENWNFWLDIKIIFMTAFGGMINKEKITKVDTDK